MKHTECEDCKLREGDCGHHFKMDGKTHYDIASLTACDRYGNCEFFKPKEKPQGDFISRQALKEAFENLASDDYNEPIWYQQTVFEIIDNAKPISPKRGKWEVCYGELLRCGLKPKWLVCSECGFTAGHQTPFCSMCGADNREVNEE